MILVQESKTQRVIKQISTEKKAFIKILNIKALGSKLRNIKTALLKIV